MSVFSQLELKAARGQCIDTYEGFNSATQSHVTLINPLRGNTFPLVQNETFMCKQKHQRKKKRMCNYLSAMLSSSDATLRFNHVPHPLTSSIISERNRDWFG